MFSGSIITKYIIKNDAITVIAIEKLYIELLVILVSFFAFIDPLTSRNAISATIATEKRTPPAEVIFVKENEVNSDIKSEITTDGVQKTVKYLSELPISSLAFANFCGFNLIKRMNASIPIIRIAPSIA